MRHHPAKPLFLLTAFLLGSVAQAAAPDSQTEKQRLQSLLQALEQATQQRRQQQARERALARQLDCNWSLIRAYEACEQLYKTNTAKHLQCSTTAKRNAARCLKNGGRKERE